MKVRLQEFDDPRMRKFRIRFFRTPILACFMFNSDNQIFRFSNFYVLQSVLAESSQWR